MSKGKLLRFRRPKTSDTLRVRFLRLLCDEGHYVGQFSVTSPRAEYRYYLDTEGEIDECFGIYQDEDGVTLLEEEYFEDEDKKVVEESLLEAKGFLRAELKNWETLSVSDKLKLKITWSEDIIAEIEQRLRDFVHAHPPREHCDFLCDLVREIESMDHYKMALYAALQIL